MSVSTLGYKGKARFWQISTDGGTTWKTAAALQKKDWKIDNEDIDTTNDTTAGNLKELSPGVQTPDTSIEGFAYSAAAPTGFVSFKELLTICFNQTIISQRLVDDIVTPSLMNLAGMGYIKSIEQTEETNKYTTFKAALSFQTLTIS